MLPSDELRSYSVWRFPYARKDETVNGTSTLITLFSLRHFRHETVLTRAGPRKPPYFYPASAHSLCITQFPLSWLPPSVFPPFLSPPRSYSVWRFLQPVKKGACFFFEYNLSFPELGMRMNVSQFLDTASQLDNWKTKINVDRTRSWGTKTSRLSVPIFFPHKNGPILFLIQTVYGSKRIGIKIIFFRILK